MSSLMMLHFLLYHSFLSLLLDTKILQRCSLQLPLQQFLTVATSGSNCGVLLSGLSRCLVSGFFACTVFFGISVMKWKGLIFDGNVYVRMLACRTAVN